MALPTNAFATYEAIGNREDLSDMIYRIDPTETPFMSSIEKAKASAVLHEWQTQALATAVSTNLQLEGDDASADAATPSVRLTNYAVIARKVPQVTLTQQAVDHAGRGNEMAYQEMLKGLELKRDMEMSVIYSTGNTTGGGKVAGADATIRRLGPVLSWIKTNTNMSTGTTTGVPGTGDGVTTTTDGTQRAFTEAQLKSVLSAIWTQGGKPDTIMVGAFNKQVFLLC